jgi:predicted negative regulator of RcsB-dependent stress response
VAAEMKKWVNDNYREIMLLSMLIELLLLGYIAWKA